MLNLIRKKRRPRPMATRYYDAHALRLLRLGDRENLARYQAYRQRFVQHTDSVIQGRWA